MRLKNFTCAVGAFIFVLSSGVHEVDAGDKDTSKSAASSTKPSKTYTSAGSSSKSRSMKVLGRLFSSSKPKTLESCGSSLSREKSSGRLKLVDGE